MKRTSFILGMLMAGSALITSCNKDLKDDVKDLKGQVTELGNLIGTNESITVTTTFKDNNNADRTVTGTYKFKAGDYDSHSMTKNLDGTYDVIIARYDDLWGEEGTSVEFNYNPTTKAITNKVVRHYWDFEDLYHSRAYYYEYYDEEEMEGVTFNINIEKFDVNSGDVALKVETSATGNYTDYINSWYVPNAGKSMNTKFSFTGKLKKFVREDD